MRLNFLTQGCRSFSRLHRGLFIFVILVTGFLLRAQASSAYNSPASSPPPPSVGKTVMVTGANGYLASHIVQQLVRKGYTVHACVRDATNKNRVGHLLRLPVAPGQLMLFSTGDLGDDPKGRCCFDEPMKGCHAVFHAATSLRDGNDDGENQIYKPAMASTQELLDCVERNSNTVEYLVLTSSMSAVAPRPEPAVKDESHWSDEEEQRARGNWYGCTKTSQEKLAQSWTESAKAEGKVKPSFKYAAICPTMVLGPSLNTSPDVSGTMGRLLDWFRGSMQQAPNDSMSFIHVKDCAAMHIAAMERPEASGRYMSLVESLHWNDIAAMMKEICPAMPDVKPFGGDLATPTQFNLDKMRSLGVAVKPTRTILEDSLSFFMEIGALGA